MTRSQKEALVSLVLNRVGDIIEFWGEIATDLANEGVTSQEAAEVLASWMKRLPGTAWDARLPYPS
jgi:hypothetical protein